MRITRLYLVWSGRFFYLKNRIIELESSSIAKKFWYSKAIAKHQIFRLENFQNFHDWSGLFLFLRQCKIDGSDNQTDQAKNQKNVFEEKA